MQMRHGFTLVEMSIVLVIIGLLAASLVVGRSMIENAETRALTTEMNIYHTAFKEFVDKYQAIPGDMNNAESYWFSDDSCPSTATNTTPKTPTCNGDGNGTIGDWTNGATTGNSEYEWFRAWQQLANAGFIEGKFTGVKGATSTEALIGINVPASKTGKGGWMLLFMASDGTAADVNFFNSAVASHALIYGAATPGSLVDTPILTAVQMKAIDEKIDDGMVFTGNIRAKKDSATSCSVSALTTSDYLLTSTTQDCTLLFLLGM